MFIKNHIFCLYESPLNLIQVRSLLTLKLLGVPSLALEPHVTMNTDSSRRWQRFLHFYNGPFSLQRLKKTVLCLALTDAVLAVTAQKPSARQELDRDPTIVRLSRGEAQDIATQRFMWILHRVALDEGLALTSTLSGLLLTHGHVVARFSEYAQYPFALWQISSLYNADGQIACIEHFLDLSEDHLDYGYSLELQRHAHSTGSLASAISYLCSDAVQVELTRVLQALSASSLDVERKHAIDKKQEKSKVRSVATASRNSILQQYNVRRHLAVSQNIQIRKTNKRRRSMSSASLAVQRRPELLPRPAGFMSEAYKHEGDLPALKTFLAENREVPCLENHLLTQNLLLRF